MSCAWPGFPTWPVVRSTSGAGIGRSPSSRTFDVVSLGRGDSPLRSRCFARCGAPAGVATGPARCPRGCTAPLEQSVARRVPRADRSEDARRVRLRDRADGSPRLSGCAADANGTRGGAGRPQRRVALVPCRSHRSDSSRTPTRTRTPSAVPPSGAVLQFEPSGGLPLEPGARRGQVPASRQGGPRSPRALGLLGPLAVPRPVAVLRGKDRAMTSRRVTPRTSSTSRTTPTFGPVLDPRADGTARWSGQRAPGYSLSGRGWNGERRSSEARRHDALRRRRSGIRTVPMTGVDVHATSIDCPAGDGGHACRASGIVVLARPGAHRSLRSASSEGPTSRRNPMWSSEPRPKVERLAASEDLSAWLRGAIERDECWTVIIAGGDLIARGTIDVDTPLLLVAGGRIRGECPPRRRLHRSALAARAMVGDSNLPFRQGSGGPGSVGSAASHRRADRESTRSSTDVRGDQFAGAQGGGAATLGSVRRWSRPAIREEESVRVQYLPANALSRGEDGLGQAVLADEPMGALEADSTGGRVRVRIALTVEPYRGPWEPPFLDRLRLTWTPE